MTCCNWVIVRIASERFGNSSTRDNCGVPSVWLNAFSKSIKIAGKTPLTFIYNGKKIEMLSKAPLCIHQSRVVIRIYICVKIFSCLKVYTRIECYPIAFAFNGDHMFVPPFSSKPRRLVL